MSDPTGAIGAVGQASGLRTRALDIAASGMSVQRQRMETIATNVANAETTRTEGGGPYRRRVVEISAGDRTPAPVADAGARNGTQPAVPPTPTDGSTLRAPGAYVTAITEDPSEGPRVYEPGHPDADADGYVRYPNVNVTQEMVDMMDARRLFEANATVFQSVKAMLRRAIDI